jgi:uncharacterized protein YciI
MKYFALFYYFVDDYLSKRTQFREEHLQLANESHKNGALILAGAFSGPADKALLVFKTADKSTVEEFVSKDPYVKNWLVTRWEIRDWNVVIGNN